MEVVGTPCGESCARPVRDLPLMDGKTFDRSGSVSNAVREAPAIPVESFSIWRMLLRQP